MTPPSKGQVQAIRERWQRAYDVPGLRYTPVAQRDVDLGALLTAHERADLATLGQLHHLLRDHVPQVVVVVGAGSSPAPSTTADPRTENRC